MRARFSGYCCAVRRTPIGMGCPMIIEGDQDNDEDDQAETLDMRSAKVVVLMPLEESSQSSPQRIRLQQAPPGDGIIKE
jgi:hypothetical protein